MIISPEASRWGRRKRLVLAERTGAVVRYWRISGVVLETGFVSRGRLGGRTERGKERLRVNRDQVTK